VTLARKLRVLRAQEGLSIIEVSRRAGIGRDTLSDLEHGHRRPTMATVRALSDVYGVPVEQLLDEHRLQIDRGPAHRLRAMLQNAAKVTQPLVEQSDEDIQAFRQAIARMTKTKADAAGSDAYFPDETSVELTAEEAEIVDMLLAQEQRRRVGTPEKA